MMDVRGLWAGGGATSIGRRRLLRLMGTGAASAVIATGVSFASTRSARAAAPAGSLSGLPWLSGCTGDPLAYAALRGRPVDVINVFPQKTTWVTMRAMSGLGWLVDRRTGPRPETICISYALFPKNESPQTRGRAFWQAAAGGAFDGHHDTAATNLARYPQNFLLRAGWEWNHPSFPWACTDASLAGLYKDYFRRVVDRFRARVPNIKIDWCSAKAGRAEVGIQHFYPGSDWVDIIGHDRYDWWPAAVTQEAWDKEYMRTRLGGPKGIGAWLAYARSEGKPMGIGEWGLARGDGAGGDNPVFIRNMLGFFARNAADIAYENYFNNNTGVHDHRLASYRNASAAMRATMAATT